jgi:transglutaminase superfamily protein
LASVSRARTQLRRDGSTVAPARRRMTVTTHKPGMPHIRSTIKKMSELANEAQHTYRIRNLATRITRDVPSKSPTAELFALYKWVRDNVRYRYDPLGLEWVQAPHVTVEEAAGDCDDMSTLLAALAGSLGHPWRFRTVGQTPQAQQHVQLQVNDRKRWLNLDPVLEPTQKTTAPRTDLGTFALYAPGAQHLWSSEGNMLSGPTSRGDRSLWTWIPYFPPPVPPRGGLPPAMPGAFPPIDTRYRSPDAPGFQGGMPMAQVLRQGRRGRRYGGAAGNLSGPVSPAEQELWAWRPYDPAGLSGAPVTLAFPVGYIDERRANTLGEVFVQHPTLGAGFLKKVAKGIRKVTKSKAGKVLFAPITIAHKITHGKKSPIRKLEMKIQKGVAKALPFTKPFISAHNKISGGVYTAMERTGLAKKGETLRIPGKIDASTIASIASRSGGGAALSKLTGQAAALAKKVDPKLRGRYPKQARMLWDRGARVYRVYMPTRGLDPKALASLRKRGGKAARLSGLGAVRPTLSFSLGAMAPADQRTQNIKPPASVAAAQKMVSAIETFKRNHQGKPPAIKLPAVLAFQQTDDALNKDGLYGSNSQTAASYYLGRPAPDHAPGLRQPITWSPPFVVLPSAAPAAAPSSSTRPSSSTQPVQVTGPRVVPAPATAPAAGMKPPAGYVEIGSEKTSPGLLPVGYSEPSAARPMSPGAVAPAPSAVSPAPAAYKPAKPLIEEDEETPSNVVPLFPSMEPATARSTPDGAPVAPGSPTPVIEVTGPRVVDVAPGNPPPVGPLTPVQDAMPPAHYPPSGTFTQPGGGTITYGPAMPPEEPSSDGEGIMWAAILYLYLRNRKKRAA